MMSRLVATPWKESSLPCDCCGKTTKTIWGDVADAERAVAVYYVQWTGGSPEHDINFDLIIGRWGDDGAPDQRQLVSLLYRPDDDGGSFMVIDGDSRLGNMPEKQLCSRTLKRDEVVGKPISKEAFDIVDAIWLQDQRLFEVKSWNALIKHGI